MTALRRILRLSAAFLGSNIARAGIAFALSLVIGRALGIERFGRWILCTTWASTLTAAADLGIGLLLPRDGARPGADHGRLCANAIAIRLALAVPAAAAMLVAPRFVALDPETARGLRVAALLGVSGAAYGCFGATFRSQPAWVAPVLIVETAWFAVQCAACWILLRSFDAGVPALLWVATAIQLLQIATALGMWRLAFGTKEPIGVPSWTATCDTFRRALPFAAAGAIANLQNRVAPLMLGYLSSASELGGFAAAARFGTTARLAPGAIFAGALPVLSDEHGRGDGEADVAFRSFDRALAALALVTAVLCVALARPLLATVYGPAFAVAAPALVAIGIGVVPGVTNSAAKIALYAAGAERLALVWSAVSLAVQIACAALLMPRFGAAGAAVAIAIGESAIWLPLRRARTAARARGSSSRRRAPAPTIVPPQPAVRVVADPAGAQ